MRISVVVATSPDGVIGRDGRLPWHLPSDLRRFRSITWGHPIIMGRRTHESIGRPLPGRLNIVLTRRDDDRAEGCTVARSPDEAVAAAANSGASEAMVIGGAEVYRAFLPIAETVHLTVVEGRFDGDVTFPIADLGPPAWVVEHREHHPADDRNPYPHRYERLRWVRPGDDGIDTLRNEP